MKALIVTKTTDPNVAVSKQMQTRGLYATLEAMNIGWSKRTIVSGATFTQAESESISDKYDFIVIPYTDAGYSVLLADTFIDIPVFCLASDAGVNPVQFGTDNGLTAATARNYYYIDSPWTTSKFCAMRTASYSLDGATAIATISAVDAVSGAAQSPSGNAAMFYYTNSSGVTFYVSCAAGDLTQALPLLMQSAINNGHLTLDNTIRIAPMSLDLDHVQGGFAIADETILDVIASYVPAGGVIWGGVTNGTGGLETPELIAKLKQYSGKPFLYCWHDHDFAPTIGSNLDDNGYSINVTREQQYDKYVADRAAWEAYGLEYHTPAFYNPGSNAWDENSIELFSEENTKQQSRDRDVAQAGFGFRAFRIALTLSSRAADMASQVYKNAHRLKQRIRGIQIIYSVDQSLNSDVPYTTAQDWTEHFRNIMQTFAFGSTVYLHDEDFQSALQEPGVQQHGVESIKIFSETAVWLKDLAKPFANPVDYVRKVKPIK